MCIIIIKEAGVDMPSNEILENCFDSNPDGAGYMFARAGQVHIRKGFMRINELQRALAKEKFTALDTVIIHFRITTSGGTKKENCHPFPLSGNEKEICNLRISAAHGMAHNGIIGQGTKNLSDTMLFVRDIASHKTFLKGIFGQEKNIIDFIEYYTMGSRLVFLNGAGELVLFGTWLPDDKSGLIFSNGTFERTKYDWEDYAESRTCPECGGLAAVSWRKSGYYECDECAHEFREADTAPEWGIQSME